MNDNNTSYKLFFLILFCAFWKLPKAQTIYSPDEDIAFTIKSDSSLFYTVKYKGQNLINNSSLGLELEDEKLVSSNLKVVDRKQFAGTESYRLVTGKTDSVADKYNGIKLRFSGDKYDLIIEVRAFNDAVAFRYILPKQEELKSLQLKQEHTEFRISKDATAYLLELPHYQSMYESEFVKLPLSALSNQGGVSSNKLIGLPVLMDVPGIAWMAITEADIKNSAAMYLTNPSGSWTGHWLESMLALQLENSAISISTNLPYESAWRIIQVADRPGELIESNVVTDLNPDSHIKDTSWIKAGKASWNWWGGSLNENGEPSLTTENMKRYVDFSARSGFKYMLLDAGWATPEDITKMNGRVNVPELIRYANEKNVGVWIWVPADGVAKQMEEAFPLYEQWGVAGIKVDFIERDDQKGIQFYYEVAKAAAKNHLMVDFHGSTKPTGIHRTWPNVMGYEAVLGMEQSKAGRRDNPAHHVTIPFTRMLAGPMDYTPGGFDNATRESFEPRMINPEVMGTRAHHLAMYVIYEVPFQMVSDHPSAYKGQPGFNFIRNVPATWDETVVLNGYPGKYLTIARKKDNVWYVGAMTNNSGRKLEIPMDFLKQGQYQATIYKDAPDSGKHPKKILIDKKTLNSSSLLEIDLASSGGFAMCLKKVN